MYTYSTVQWILFFFIYCFCGWIWESCYVSLRKRHWVNRGFLNGPLLPIYGSGAILILLATIPVKDQLWLVYILGVIAATVLEYVTGAAMERLFQVRYWDYSNQPCNLNGYICLSSSLAWGVFSIIMVRFLHPPVERFLMKVPDFLTDPLAFILVVYTTADVIQSFNAAMDLREILTKLTEENDELRRLARRAEVFAAFAEDDLRTFRERTQVEKLLMQDRIQQELQQRQDSRTAQRAKRKMRLEEDLRHISDAKLQALQNIAQTLESYQDHMEESLAGQALAERKAEISETLEKLRNREFSIRQRNNRTYRRSLRILRGNPSAKAKSFAEAMESLRELYENKKD